MKTFQSAIVEGGPYIKNYEKEETLKRTLVVANNELFKKTTIGGACCERFTLEKDPVFMLKSIMLSTYGQGPTLENVCKMNERV